VTNNPEGPRHKNGVPFGHTTKYNFYLVEDNSGRKRNKSKIEKNKEKN
jgi:hypothetical protein